MTAESVIMENGSALILRARSWLYAGVAVAASIVLLANPNAEHIAIIAMVGLGLVVPAVLPVRDRLYCAFALDTFIALAAWWLFGPAVGSDFLLLIIAAIAGILYQGTRHHVLVAWVFLSAAAQIPLHFWAKASPGLPLFHETSQIISDGEFVAGVLVRLLVLALASVLLGLVGREVRASRLAMAESEATFRSAFDEAPIGVALLRVDGLVLRANSQLRDVVFQGQTIEESALSAQATDSQKLRSAFAEVTSGGRGHWSGQFGWNEQDRWFQVALSSVESSGEVAAVMIVEDVTPRVRNHRRLEELIKSKDQFVASVSHELRTPLTAVVGFADILAGAWRSLDPPELENLISDIARESREVASIVEDLLVIARADIGTVTLLPERLNTEDELTVVLSSVDPRLTDQIHVHGSAAIVWADPVRFRQIVRNLLTNALRYGGKQVEIQTSLGEGMVQIEVADDGDGVLGDDPDRIFQPYVRAHENPTQPGSVGLGLAVSRSLARAMDGELAYIRTPGRTSFSLTLPAPEMVMRNHVKAAEPIRRR